MRKIAFALILATATGCESVSVATDNVSVCNVDPVYLTDEEAAALRPETLLTIDGNNAVLLEEGCVED